MHGMKGIIGAMRAESYEPSTYGAGDKGGAAGGYGLPHGAAGSATGPGSKPMAVAASSYGGTPIMFEGGYRGGAVSEPETRPAQYPYPKKLGYDERSSRHEGGGVHGVSGVEGIPRRAGGDGMAYGAMGAGGYADEDEAGEHEMGAKCGMAGCAFVGKTTHGLARHAIKKHKRAEMGHALRAHGMRPISDAAHERTESPAEEREEHRTGRESKHMMTGRHGMRPISDAAHERTESPAEEREEHRTGRESKHMMTGRHGSAYGTDREFPGETEGPTEWRANERLYARAKAKIISNPSVVGPGSSSYAAGDVGGAYGRRA